MIGILRMGIFEQCFWKGNQEFHFVEHCGINPGSGWFDMQEKHEHLQYKLQMFGKSNFVFWQKTNPLVIGKNLTHKCYTKFSNIILRKKNIELYRVFKNVLRTFLWNMSLSLTRPWKNMMLALLQVAILGKNRWLQRCCPTCLIVSATTDSPTILQKKSFGMLRHIALHCSSIMHMTIKMTCLNIFW